MKNDAAFVFLPVGFLAQKVRKYPKKQLAGNKLILKINVTLFYKIPQNFNIYEPPPFFYASAVNFFFSILSLYLSPSNSTHFARSSLCRY